MCSSDLCAVAVVAHVVVAHKRSDVLHESLLHLYVVAHERVERMHSLERVVGIVLVEILRLYVPSVLMPVGASVVHHHVGVVGLYLLRAQREVESVRHEQLCLRYNFKKET